MYAGLTIADKPALMDAKARGKKTLTMAFSDRVQVVDIDIALAQIAELESAEKPLTWNERINQMTAEEKAEWIKEYLFDAACEGVCMYNGCNGACTENITAFFNSPHTEGETVCKQRLESH